MPARPRCRTVLAQSQSQHQGRQRERGCDGNQDRCSTVRDQRVPDAGRAYAAEARSASTTSRAKRSTWARWSPPGQKMKVSKPSSVAKPESVSIQCSGGPWSKLLSARPRSSRSRCRCAGSHEARGRRRPPPRRCDGSCRARARESPSRATAPSRPPGAVSARARGFPTPSQMPIACAGGGQDAARARSSARLRIGSSAHRSSTRE